jgi:hypothetical protein
VVLVVVVVVVVVLVVVVTAAFAIDVSQLFVFDLLRCSALQMPAVL